MNNAATVTTLLQETELTDLLASLWFDAIWTTGWGCSWSEQTRTLSCFAICQSFLGVPYIYAEKCAYQVLCIFKDNQDAHDCPF